MTNKLWYIQQLDLFKGIAHEKLNQIEMMFAMKEYCKREVIFEPGDLGADGDPELFVEAATNSYVCSLEKNKFFTLVSLNPELSEKLMKQLFQRLLHVEKRMSSVASDNALQKIIKLFLSLGRKKTDRLMELPTKFTHDELAQMLGISRQTVTTLINQLEKKKLILRQGKAVAFNPKELQDLTE